MVLCTYPTTYSDFRHQFHAPSRRHLSKYVHHSRQCAVCMCCAVLCKRVMMSYERNMQGNVRRARSQGVSYTGLGKSNGAKLRESFCPAAASHSRPRLAGA